MGCGGWVGGGWGEAAVPFQMNVHYEDLTEASVVLHKFCRENLPM